MHRPASFRMTDINNFNCRSSASKVLKFAEQMCSWFWPKLLATFTVLQITVSIVPVRLLLSMYLFVFLPIQSLLLSCNIRCSTVSPSQQLLYRVSLLPQKVDAYKFSLILFSQAEWEYDRFFLKERVEL